MVLVYSTWSVLLTLVTFLKNVNDCFPCRTRAFKVATLRKRYSDSHQQYSKHRSNTSSKPSRDSFRWESLRVRACKETNKLARGGTRGRHQVCHGESCSQIECPVVKFASCLFTTSGNRNNKCTKKLNNNLGSTGPIFTLLFNFNTFSFLILFKF